MYVQLIYISCPDKFRCDYSRSNSSRVLHRIEWRQPDMLVQIKPPGANWADRVRQWYWYAEGVYYERPFYACMRVDLPTLLLLVINTLLFVISQGISRITDGHCARIDTFQIGHRMVMYSYLLTMCGGKWGWCKLRIRAKGTKHVQQAIN